MIPTREQIEADWAKDGAVTPLIAKIDEMLAQPCPEAPESPKLQPAAAVPDDTRELVAQLADLVAWAMPTMNHHKGVKAIAAKLRGGSTVPVEGTSDEILQLPRDDQRWELVAQLADVVASIWGRSDCIEGEAKAIAAKLRGGA